MKGKQNSGMPETPFRSTVDMEPTTQHKKDQTLAYGTYPPDLTFFEARTQTDPCLYYSGGRLICRPFI